MEEGSIVAGVLAPHPPHLVYAENPPQNEPRANGGWETLRWAYQECRKDIAELKPDVIIVHTPHWQTIIGHHLLGLPNFSGKSVDPIFPHLFRYNFDMSVDVELANEIASTAKQEGLTTTLMKNPNFRIDYGSITCLHLINPEWNIPVIVISSTLSPYYFAAQDTQKEVHHLGIATQQAVRKLGRKALLLASNSLSHHHFTQEPEIPEDMEYERPYSDHHYKWDMKILSLMAEGKCQQLLETLPEYISETDAEIKAGGLVWMLAALGYPSSKAKVHGYGTVIGTGNAVVQWRPHAQ